MEKYESVKGNKITVLVYSEVPNRRASLLIFFRFSFHSACNFSCNKQKIPPCSFISLLSKKAGKMEFFSNPTRLFKSALLLGTSEYSHLFNKRGGWNKRGGGAKVAKLPNVEAGINVKGGIFWKKLVRNCSKRGVEGERNQNEKLCLHFY